MTVGVDAAEQVQRALRVDPAGALAQRVVDVAGVVLQRNRGELQHALREVRRERHVLGVACFSSATTPVATPAAMLVPDSCMKSLPDLPFLRSDG